MQEIKYVNFSILIILKINSFFATIEIRVNWYHGINPLKKPEVISIYSNSLLLLVSMLVSNSLLNIMLPFLSWFLCHPKKIEEIIKKLSIENHDVILVQ